MVWSGWGEFEGDPGCYEEDVLEGQEFWVGCGRVLVAGNYFPNQRERQVCSGVTLRSTSSWVA